MSQLATRSTPDNSALQSLPTQTTLEDWFQGLSGNDVMQLHRMITCRLSSGSSPQIRTTNTARELVNTKRLTARESEVLTLVASGYTRPEVAKALNISRNTAAKHVANIYRKLEVESIAEATMIAFRWGIVS
ncbi:MAG: response regulator transcription factor [Granulosicoccus sp.]